MENKQEREIDYEGYFYDEECVFGKQILKERLEKQLGDFGEQLVMTLLGRIARYSVALVDHEGADLIASDKQGHEYAISVKSYQIGPDENETKVFKTKDQEKLCEFAAHFDLIPAVAMIIISKDFAFIDLYLMTMAGFQHLATLDGDVVAREAVKKVDHGLQINNYSLGKRKIPKHSDGKGYLKYLHENELINHIRLDVRNRSNFYKEMAMPEKVYIKQTEEDGNLSRQLGDFGEYFLMMLLGQVKGYKVARVDHVGADLIARDRQGNRCAISVKTTRKGKYTFNENYISEKKRTPDKELSKLVEFTDKYPGMQPVVAMVFVDEQFDRLDIYIAGLDTWLELGFEGKYKAIQYSFMQEFLYNGQAVVLDKWQEQLDQLTININDKKKKAKMDAEESIEHMEMTFNSLLDPNKKW